jgi:phosphatidylserine decarboxylase
MRIARQAWPFALPLAALSAVLAAAGWIWTSALACALGIGVLLFFRIPAYHFTGPDDAILAPAWGIITRIDEVTIGELGERPAHRIVTFLSVFDVHVQRSPCAGRVVLTRYHRGRKIAAFREDAGEVNERRLTILERAAGDRLAICQIAGLVARRVVTYLASDQSVERGDLIGMIRFGSRVDLILPDTYAVLVEPGQRVHGGATIMARPKTEEVPTS